MKIGFLEEAEGVKSSTRLNIFIILIVGLLQVSGVVASGIWLFVVSHGDKIGLGAITAAAAAMFAAVVSPCIVWKSISKPQEAPAVPAEPPTAPVQPVAVTGGPAAPVVVPAQPQPPTQEPAAG